MRAVHLPRVVGWLCLAAMLALASPGVRITRVAQQDAVPAPTAPPAAREPAAARHAPPRSQDASPQPHREGPERLGAPPGAVLTGPGRRA